MSSQGETLYTCEIYPSADEGRRAFDALLAAGAPAEDVRLLVGHASADVRDEPVGGFAGEVEPDEEVGSFDDTTHERRTPRSEFADEASEKTQGSFADAEDNVVVELDHGEKKSHELSHHELVSLLEPVAVDHAHLEQLHAELEAGHALVIAKRA
jgi:hypothetical protein